MFETSQWHHNGRDGVSNHQPHDCLLYRLFRCRSKEASSSASLAFVRGIHRWPANSPHKWPVTRKMFPFDDVIINCKFEITPMAPRGRWINATRTSYLAHDLIYLIPMHCQMYATQCYTGPCYREPGLYNGSVGFSVGPCSSPAGQ